MARKIAVKFNGKTIGVRTTDRPYTHALVLTDFNPDLCRKLHLEYWAKDGRASTKSGWFHAREAQHLGYKYASVITDAARAEYAAIAAKPFDLYYAEHAAALQRLEEHITKVISRGAEVLSYHGSRAPAFKAQSKASVTHPCCLVLVEPTELILTGRDAKTSPAAAVDDFNYVGSRYHY
jgi:hypothetical protein